MGHNYQPPDNADMEKYVQRIEKAIDAGVGRIIEAAKKAQEPPEPCGTSDHMQVVREDTREVVEDE